MCDAREGSRQAREHTFVKRGWAMGLLILSWAAMHGAVTAQELQPVFTNKSSFRIPFQFDQQELSRIGAIEVQLHVSTDQGRTWKVSQSVVPSARKFSFQAPENGEYWFSVRTIDAQGNPHPLGQLRPSLVVIVDDEPPTLTLTVSQNKASQRTTIAWQAQDDYLDPQTLRIEVLDETSGVWQPIQAPQRAAGMIERIGSTPDSLMVRGYVSDRAGNSTSTTSRGRPSRAPRSETETPDIPDLREPVAENGSLGVSPFFASARKQGRSSLPTILPNIGHGPVSVAKTSTALPLPASKKQAPDASATTTQQQLASSPLARNSALAIPSAQKPATEAWQLANAQRVNSRSFRIGYAVDDVGPSGVGSVDLYITEDQGNRWFHYGNDPDRRSPFDVIVPRDGIYGFAIRVRNGSGIVANPPQPGEAPEVVVVIDQQAPAVTLRPVKQVLISGTLQVLIEWSAHDAQLAERPVALYQSTQLQGPWEPITGWIENTGRYQWHPALTGSRPLFVKIEVRDAAGNIARQTTRQALMLDVSQPKARILDIQSSRAPLSPGL